MRKQDNSTVLIVKLQLTELSDCLLRSSAEPSIRPVCAKGGFWNTNVSEIGQAD